MNTSPELGSTATEWALFPAASERTAVRLLASIIQSTGAQGDELLQVPALAASPEVVHRLADTLGLVAVGLGLHHIYFAGLSGGSVAA